MSDLNLPFQVFFSLLQAHLVEEWCHHHNPCRYMKNIQTLPTVALLMGD